MANGFQAIPTTTCQQRRLQAALLVMFLDTATRTAQWRTHLVSKSALSRLLNAYPWDTAQGWTIPPWDALLLAARRNHCPLLRLSARLTSVEKEGSVLPFVRAYDKVHGIHLVVLFAEYSAVKFPVGYRVDKSRAMATFVTLARDSCEPFQTRSSGDSESVCWPTAAS